MRKSFKAGELLFSEGGASDCVYRVVSGSIDVVRDLGDETILLGSVEIGQFLGEMGVIDQMPRSASARAATGLEVEVFSPEEFFQEVSTSPTTALELIHRLSTRLRDVSNQLIGAVLADNELADRIVGGAPANDTAHAASQRALTVAAASPELEAQLGKSPKKVSELPYIVGRRAEEGEAGAAVPLDLAIDDHHPYRLSRAHFILLEEYGKPVVRDLSSALGTVVNGRSIGRNFPLDVAHLTDGDNSVSAGGTESPYRFTITVS